LHTFLEIKDFAFNLTALVPCFNSGYNIIDATASLQREEFMAVRIYSTQFSGLPVSRAMCLLGSMYLRPKAVQCYLQLSRTIEMTLVLVMELSEIEEASDDIS
jgi:hypothetical protein